MNLKKIKAIEKVNKNCILSYFPNISDEVGVYIMTREENGFKYAYIGQAQKILTRLAGHLRGYQHIDLSIKKHGFYSNTNITGWKIIFLYCTAAELDEKEKRYIKKYANEGYQLRNKTAGGQGKGKFAIAENKPSKGYYDGLKQGYKNAQKEITKLFASNLTATHAGEKLTKTKEKALLKFKKFIEVQE